MSTVAGSQTARLMSLFEGYSAAFGTYEGTVENQAKGGKLEIKATARTVRSEVTLELWQQHVSGKSPLGIIPLRDNDTCVWGVIDIDNYGLVYADVLSVVEREKLPLVACRSKSGGMHLFMFTEQPVAAVVMQTRLREMAAVLGYGSSEVFPKQHHVEWDRGDLGSWLNMPYFGGDSTDRYGIKATGLGMTLSEFLTLAESRRVGRDYLENKEFRKKPQSDPDWGDAPPCMQHMAAVGFPEGTRNKGLFALAAFARKKYGDQWENMVEQWNYRLFDPPLPAAEVLAILKSHRTKDYNYTCKEFPLSAHCNSVLCRTRKFGVGGEDDYPRVDGLSILESDPPLWFMDVESKRLELTTDELQNYKLFHKVCMERLFICYRLMKQDDWLRVVGEAMRDAIRIEAPPDVGTVGQFNELLEEFCTHRHKGTRKEDILLGKPWESEERKRHYFRLRDLQKFLEMANFKAYNRGKITQRIEAIGGGKDFFNIEGSGVNVWYVPSVFVPIPKSALPDISEEPI